MFAEAGLPYAGTLERVPNSRRALMLGELARDRGLFDELHPRLFNAYWAQGRDIGEETVLVSEGTAVGLEEAEILETFRQGRYLERIGEQTREAIDIGAGGVPAWVIDRRALLPGAQPTEVFAQVMERLGFAQTK